MKKIFIILILIGALVYFITLYSGYTYDKNVLQYFLQYLKTFPDIYSDFKSVIINNMTAISSNATYKIGNFADVLSLLKNVLLVIITPIQLILHLIAEIFQVFLWVFNLLSGVWLGGVANA